MVPGRCEVGGSVELDSETPQDQSHRSCGVVGFSTSTRGRGFIRRRELPSRRRKGGRTGGRTVPPKSGGMGRGIDDGRHTGEPTALPRTGRSHRYGGGRARVERCALSEWDRVGRAGSAADADSTGSCDDAAGIYWRFRLAPDLIASL